MDTPCELLYELEEALPPQTAKSAIFNDCGVDGGGVVGGGGEVAGIHKKAPGYYPNSILVHSTMRQQSEGLMIQQNL